MLNTYTQYPIQDTPYNLRPPRRRPKHITTIFIILWVLHTPNRQSVHSAIAVCARTAAIELPVVALAPLTVELNRHRNCQQYRATHCYRGGHLQLILKGWQKRRYSPENSSFHFPLSIRHLSVSPNLKDKGY